MKTKPYIWTLPDLDLQTSPKVSPWQPWNKQLLVLKSIFFAFVTFIAFDWSSRNPIRRRKPIENPIIVFRQRRFVLVFVFHSSTYHNMEMLSVWGLCKCWDGFASMQFYTLHHFIIFLAHLANAYRSLTNRASRVLASFLLKYCLKFRRNTFYLCYPAQMLWTDLGKSWHCLQSKVTRFWSILHSIFSRMVVSLHQRNSVLSMQKILLIGVWWRICAAFVSSIQIA